MRGEGAGVGVDNVGDVLVAIVEVLEGTISCREMPHKRTGGEGLGGIPDELMLDASGQAVKLLDAQVSVVDELAEGVGLGS